MGPVLCHHGEAFEEWDPTQTRELLKMRRRNRPARINPSNHPRTRLPKLFETHATQGSNQVLVMDQETCPHRQKRRIVERDNDGSPLFERVECTRCGKWFSVRRLPSPSQPQTD